MKESLPTPVEASARPRRRRDPEGTRDALIRAAAIVFNTTPFHATDSNKIARAAGYSPGAFYRHFADKREIFLAVYDRWLEQEWVEIEERLFALAPAGNAKKLGAILDAILAHHVAWRLFRANVRMLYAGDDVVRAHVLARRRAALDRVGSVRRALGASARGRADHAIHMLAVERLCDAVADGDMEALGVDRRAAKRAIAALFVDYLAPS